EHLVSASAMIARSANMGGIGATGDLRGRRDDDPRIVFRNQYTVDQVQLIFHRDVGEKKLFTASAQREPAERLVIVIDDLGQIAVEGNLPFTRVVVGVVDPRSADLHVTVVDDGALVDDRIFHMQHAGGAEADDRFVIKVLTQRNGGQASKADKRYDSPHDLSIAVAR